MIKNLPSKLLNTKDRKLKIKVTSKYDEKFDMWRVNITRSKHKTKLQ
jgi:hypothetical protein